LNSLRSSFLFVAFECTDAITEEGLGGFVVPDFPDHVLDLVGFECAQAFDSEHEGEAFHRCSGDVEGDVLEGSDCLLHENLVVVVTEVIYQEGYGHASAASPFVVREGSCYS
jgi:hypothetical protein